MTQASKTKELLTADIAKKRLGLTIEDSELTPGLVLNTFYRVWTGGAVDKRKVINAKNFLLRMIVTNQMKEKRYFEIISPFETSCISCKGAGEIYKFERTPVQVNCHICAGKKKVSVTCRSCKGSGRFLKRWKDGGGIDVKCRVCKGEGKVRVKCSHCRGKGTLKKIVPTHKIKSTTPCKICGQIGFIDENVGKTHTPPKSSNPVISTQSAILLSDMIKTKSD